MVVVVALVVVVVCVAVGHVGFVGAGVMSVVLVLVLCWRRCCCACEGGLQNKSSGKQTARDSLKNFCLCTALLLLRVC